MSEIGRRSDVGFQKLIDSVLDCPGIVAFIACGAVCVIAAKHFSDPLAGIEEMARRKRQQAGRKAAERQDRLWEAGKTKADLDFQAVRGNAQDDKQRPN